MLLQSIWFFLWALVWAVFFMTEGFDFGIGSLLPFLGKNDTDRRIMINTMGPLWDGNEVWLITAGGVTFAAFPLVYATMFSSLYAALMLLLFALIFRGVAIEFRSKLEDPRWRGVWDIFIFLGSFLPALLLGVAFANIYKGFPLGENQVYYGSLFTLLNPYGLLGGAHFLFLFMVHGALWLAARTEGDLHNRAVLAAKNLWILSWTFSVLFFIFTKYQTPIFDNYYANPLLFIIVAIVVGAYLGILYFLKHMQYFRAWFASALTIVSCAFFGFVGLFPNLFPSTISPEYSLTAFNSSSSPLTLTIMLWVVAVFVPIVIGYQTWAYNLFKHKVTEADLEAEEMY